MSTIHLHQTTTSTPEQYVAGLTDFGLGRSKLFGNSADEYLKGLGAFMRAVTELFGAEQARVAAEDWVDELEFPRLRRHCCKTSLAKPRALAARCMESQAFRSAPRSSWKSFSS
jgi:hypothetical protein